MESLPLLISENDVNKQPPVTLVSPTNPTPTQTLFLSNIDQTVAFPVETLFFFDSPTSEDIVETVKRSVSEVLLIPYYFMAGRLNFNFQTRRLELVCNNAGVLFVGASSKLTIKDLGDVSSPNPAFQHLISRTYGFRSLAETPIWTIQARFMFGRILISAERKKS
ncbi:Rosmarinate synthase [Acorus gramineus]|uniref:Rosmarinate synthase n=1 Tax=Acorus gramineus TaxID=55184 RepID=A0AAV9BV72_ACOGR|nr:Rosmarinate synthase [Acorus gramineus]